MAWQPILDGELAVRAWHTIRAIADDLAGVQEPAADLAVFWSYVSAAIDDATTSARTDEALDRFANKLASGVRTFGLHGGVVGLGWTAAHISDGIDDVLEAIDASVLRWLSTDWTGPFDLIDGLVGFGVYFLERGNDVGLAAVRDQLEKAASRDPAGAYWFTPPRLIPAKQLPLFPAGYTNLGLAHGTPGVIALLARFRVEDARARDLRHDAERWLRAHDLGAPGYPGMVDGSAARPSRTAWCYGDPGVAIALWRSAVRDGQPPDDALAKRWLARERTGVVDAPLCHGAAGLAHIANRFFQASGDSVYRDAARRYFEQTLAFAQPGAGIGGFLARVNDDWAPKVELLDGVIGIALALLAAVTPLEPEWDRMILCDLPVSV